MVFLHERMAWRTVALNRHAHLADTMRLWQGDSIGHWEGDTLVVETRNFNGKTWLNEVGEVVSHAEQVVDQDLPHLKEVRDAARAEAAKARIGR